MSILVYNNRSIFTGLGLSRFLLSLRAQPCFLLRGFSLVIVLHLKWGQFAEDGIADFALYADPDETETPKPIDDECDVGRDESESAAQA